MKTILTILLIILISSCSDKPKVIINNNIEEGIIIYEGSTGDSKYKVIEIFDGTEKYANVLDYTISKYYNIGDTIKHNVKFKIN